jgi:hypothetical protein
MLKTCYRNGNSLCCFVGCLAHKHWISLAISLTSATATISARGKQGYGMGRMMAMHGTFGWRYVMYGGRVGIWGEGESGPPMRPIALRGGCRVMEGSFWFDHFLAQFCRPLCTGAF